jgi:hypothetical protein
MGRNDSPDRFAQRMAASRVTAGEAMHEHRNAAASRAEHASFYHASRAGLLALALLLPWQGMAWAEDYIPPAASQLPDTAQGPGADRVPPGAACTDDMDLSPEDNLPDPLEGYDVAFHPAHARLARTISDDGGCPVSIRQQADKV